MTEAEKMCKRVAILHKGEIRAIGAPAELKKTHRDGTMTVELTSGQTERLAMDGESATLVANWMSQGQVDRIYTNELSLGDIFIKLTGSELV